jgi:hypothetical protein
LSDINRSLQRKTTGFQGEELRVPLGAGHKTKQTPRVYTKLASECADLALLEAFPIKRRVSSNYGVFITRWRIPAW